MTVELVLLSRVSYGGLEITGSRLRGLLALLAQDPRVGCGTSRLMDALWPDEQPEHPLKALQVLVSRARARLGSGLIVSTPSGYRLSLREDQIDASALLLSASESEKRARAGDHLAALGHAEAGLALCEGAERWDTGDGGPVSVLRAARIPAYRSLLRTRALALSRLGRRAEAAEPLTELIRQSDLDEEILVELLRCEAATAGPAAALARYSDYRQRLRDELGGDPGPALQGVYQELLRADAPVIRRGVWHEPNPLLGRDEDIAAVADLLRVARVTSIVGTGGLGKTRLAHAVSSQAEQRVVHVVELAGVAADGDVAAEVAAALGVGEEGGNPVGRRGAPPGGPAGIVAALSPGPALLVLDNCEHVVRGAADLVHALVSLSNTASGARYRMLETVREFAAVHREDAAETERVTGCFLVWARDFGVGHHDSVLTRDDLPAFELIRAEQDNLVLALRHGLDRKDAGTVAAVSAVLGGLWMAEASFARMIGLAGDTIGILPPFRPETDLVEATRTSLVLGAVSGFLLQGSSPARFLVGLRRLQPAPPDTFARAAHAVLNALHGPPGADLAAMRALSESDQPLVVGRSQRSSAGAARGYGPPRMPGSANCTSRWTRPARVTRRCVT